MENRGPMISGFTFIKNGLTLGYPIRESIESISPLCDEIVINVGFDDPECREDDGTWDYLTKTFTDEKFRFLKSWWDPSVQKEGKILSQQTNIALKECRGKYCQYIQGDEVIHEDDLETIHQGIQQMEEDWRINGLIFRYLHFYGNVDLIKYTRNIYRREIRTIRNFQGIESWKDAQGFRHQDGDKVRARQIEARIFHYGWARSEQIMKEKVKEFDKLYHGRDYENPETFRYERIWGLKPFKGKHPQVMLEWIRENRNQLEIDQLPLRFEWKNIGLALSDGLEKLTGLRVGEYKNFIEI